MLRELQRDFARAVYDEHPAVVECVCEGQFSAVQRVQIYRNNVNETLTAALADVFPVVQKLVGLGFFGYAVNEYLYGHRPLSPNLHDFGGAFGDFLSTFAPAATLAYLPDVARLEWARHRALHAADAPPFDPAALALLPTGHLPDLHFTLHPSAQLLQSDHPVMRIVEVNQDQYTGDMKIDFDAGGAQVLVIRRNLEVSVERLPSGDYALLHALHQNRPLEAALDSALSAQPEFNLQAVLHRHISRRTITGFRDA